ncbi:hypothetical protein CDD80_1227 [Ophiocordyceps camponoti-rufipedis]|uniref:Zn(2)-C6 fungal-type domain-containing protein n=1 Tax=Ophiocordyceps camponoti-rufipedis TaxID=2004952 RepID=A0A2C5Z6Y8_9HYPO|nr:hypothetical protein CDD80_1227 [Ophiocordyceps camponoti-rufipedis]
MATTASVNRLEHMPSLHDNDREDPKGKKPAIKKRTKTGCLTCRKRRIKCDENKPRCKNCVKSKRECEGYNQRVVFKDPMGAQQSHYPPAIYPTPMQYLGDPLVSHHAKPPAQLSLQPIAPKPSTFTFHGHHQVVTPQQPPNLDGFGHVHLSAALHPSMPNPLLVPSFASEHDQNIYDLGPPPQFQPAPQQHHFVNNMGQGPNVVHRPPAVEDAAFPLPVDDFTRVPDLEFDTIFSEDDAYLAESDDEHPDARRLMAPGLANMPWPCQTTNGSQVRTFSAFAREQALSEYMNFAPNSELRNHAMRTIFMHFISVTGPSMSLYERDAPPNTEQGQFVPNADVGNNLFSYTFPVLSLNHPGLLHAIMAIASLQVAKIQGTPATAALKHYHLSIRRIAKNVRSPLRRTKLSTLAATLLLAYFEVWSSDHTKWCSHLFGARHLFREIALRDMSRICLPAKRLRWSTGLSAAEAPPVDLDYQLLTVISGTRVSAEDYGLQEDQPLDQRCLFLTDKDLEQYDILRDLFWWYSKMDVYQSILGGTRLFMEYEAWTQCPPRGPFSDIHAIYGTYDHLILLLGRLADFTSKDLARKRKANRNSQTGINGGSPPQFPGIVPTYGKFRVPMGFSPEMAHSPQTDTNDDSEAPQSLEAAENEWESIRQGFEALESHLGPQFQHLNSEYADRMETPFGSALQYRTYSVAGIWMNYYMGLIHLYRGRPCMPPAAMQAAQVAAPSTAGYAIQIGRIAAGLAEDCSRTVDLSTTLAAAFIESCFCLFVAAVQLQNNEQRCWVVQRMYDISRLTGWQSAKKIAHGCESAWLKAYQLGHGPEYLRPENLDNVPVSVWMLPRRLDQKISELDEREETRLVLVRSEQTNLAFGLLGVEGDLDRIELADDS